MRKKGLSYEYEMAIYAAKLSKKILFRFKGISYRSENIKIFENILSLSETLDKSQINYPDYYMVDPKELVQVSVVRDKMISKEKKRFDSAMISLEKITNATKARRVNEQNYLTVLEKKLAKINKRLARATEAFLRVSLEGTKEKCEVAIINQRKRLENTDGELKTYQNISDNNNNNWKLQLANLQDVYVSWCETFVRSATKSIRRKYGYNKFEFIKAPIRIDGITMIEEKRIKKGGR